MTSFFCIFKDFDQIHVSWVQWGKNPKQNISEYNW